MCNLPRGYTLIADRDLAHLNAFYLSPLCGMWDLGAVLVAEWGHVPEDHPELLAVLEVELSGALVETAADLMRERGLRDLRVEPASAPAP
jgi:hypothetical protein